MIRYTLLFLFISFLCIHSFKDWYKALCYSFPLLAVLERPDMPKSFFGIGGLSPFNIVMVCLLTGWFLQKAKENLKWPDVPLVNKFLVVYMAIVLFTTIRMFLDYSGFIAFSVDLNWPLITKGDLIKDDFINTVKFMIPGLLLAHGTTSKERANLAINCILATNLLFMLQITSKMLPVLVSGEDVATRSFRVLNRDIGYFRGELAPLMASAAWAFVVTKTTRLSSNFNIAGFLWGTLCVVLTGGRGGAMAWAATGLVFGFFRWRKILILGPLVVLLVISLVPSITHRYEEGFTEDTYAKSAERRGLDTIDDEGRDLYAISSGRVVVWPRVIQYIKRAPWFGYGRKAMVREGVNQSLVKDGTFAITDSMFMHPHNAYLEQFLDNGLIGGLPVISFFLLIGWLAMKRIKDKSLVGTTDYTIAGLVLAYVIVRLAHGMTADSFYPKQVHMLMWCAIGLFIASLGGVFAKEDAQQKNETDSVPKKKINYYS